MTNQRGMPSVLVVDDDPATLRIVSIALQMNGYFAVTSPDAEHALALFPDVQPQLLIVDVRLPSMDGLSFCRRIRSVSDVPIMMLTIVDNPLEAARAFEAGADDYVRKPFAVEELIARAKALLRRMRPGVLGAELVVAGPLAVDGARRTATVDGRDLVLSSSEFALLAYLASNRDRVLTHGQILEAVWGPEYVDSRHVLRVTMSRLRQKLPSSTDKLIQTLPRVGYRLHAVESHEAA